jgi:HSP20 family protein
MLTKWDPFQDMLNLRTMVDRMFEDFYGGGRPLSRTSTWGFALDVAEDEDEFTVKASLPGIKADDIDITYTENTLTIKGEIKEDKEIAEPHYHMRERRYGSFARSITLPSKVKPEEIDANFTDGVLTIHMPKTEEVKPKRISIKPSSPKVIEGKVSEQ